MYLFGLVKIRVDIVQFFEETLNTTCKNIQESKNPI